LGADITYIKLEDISKDITILSKELGIYLPELEKKNTNTISYDKYDQYLTKETNDIIRYVYEEDFSNFKY
jgi:GTPase involved in cell partitioning and DNA repair